MTTTRMMHLLTARMAADTLATELQELGDTKNSRIARELIEEIESEWRRWWESKGGEVGVVKRRAVVYVQRPSHYEIAGCPCGNTDPDWSEFEGHLWCSMCAKDFIPEHSGIFDGPIPVNCAAMIGIDLRQVNIETGQIIPAPD